MATFFPEPHPFADAAFGATAARGRVPHHASAWMLGAWQPPPAPAPPPAVTPPETVGLGERERAPPRDVFAGDLEAIRQHLEFGRHYHRVAMLRRYEYERAAARQHAAAAAAAAARRGAIGPDGEFAVGRWPRGARGGGGHSRGGSFSSSGDAHAQRELASVAGARDRDPGAGKPARGRSRRRKGLTGDAAGARDAGGAFGGFAAAAAAAIAAGAEPPRGRAWRGGARKSGPSVSSDRRENPRSKRGSEDEGAPEGEAAAAAAAAAADPPPGGDAGDPGAGDANAAKPSWGPKGAAGLDVIRRAPSSTDVVGTGADSPKDPGVASSAGVRVEDDASPALASSATSAKGSWSSLVAAGESSRDARKPHDAPTRLQSSDASAGPVGNASPVAAESSDALAGDSRTTNRASPKAPTEPAPRSEPSPSVTTARPPTRPLAGAWAKGPVTDALKRPPSRAAPPATSGAASASASPPSPSSPASETSGDSNAEQKENPGARKKTSNVVLGAPATAKKATEPSGSEAPKAGDPTFVRRDDDFPGLGGKPAVAVATAGVWGGRKAA